MCGACAGTTRPRKTLPSCAPDCCLSSPPWQPSMTRQSFAPLHPVRISSGLKKQPHVDHAHLAMECVCTRACVAWCLLLSVCAAMPRGTPPRGCSICSTPVRKSAAPRVRTWDIVAVTFFDFWGDYERAHACVCVCVCVTLSFVCLCICVCTSSMSYVRACVCVCVASCHFEPVLSRRAP